jgi:hypothetical protein
LLETSGGTGGTCNKQQTNKPLTFDKSRKLIQWAWTQPGYSKVARHRVIARCSFPLESCAEKKYSAAGTLSLFPGSPSVTIFIRLGVYPKPAILQRLIHPLWSLFAIWQSRHQCLPCYTRSVCVRLVEQARPAAPLAIHQMQGGAKKRNEEHSSR